MHPALATAIRIAAIAAAFGLIVFVHEAGHFLSARALGMAVHEFSIGFGRPLLFWFRRGETQYSFRLWPFFSYVRIAGMEPGEDHPRGFDKKKRPAQAAVLVTGCVMNFLLAAGIYIVMGAALGLPVAVNTIQEVLPGSPAARAGLRPGDRLLGINGRLGLSVEQLREEIQAHPGRPLVFTLQRDGATRRVAISPRTETVLDIKGVRLLKVPIGRIGIVFGSRVERMGVGRSIVAGFAETYQMIRLQIAALVSMVMRTVPPEFMGPVAIVHRLNEEAKANWLGFLSMAAALTIAVGFLNLMPIPPLDGSRLLIVGLEAVRRRPFDKRKELVVHLVGFVLLLALVAILTYKDILRIVQPGGQ